MVSLIPAKDTSVFALAAHSAQIGGQSAPLQKKSRKIKFYVVWASQKSFSISSSTCNLYNLVQWVWMPYVTMLDIPRWSTWLSCPYHPKFKILVIPYWILRLLEVWLPYPSRRPLVYRTFILHEKKNEFELIFFFKLIFFPKNQNFRGRFGKTRFLTLWEPPKSMSLPWRVTGDTPAC